MNISCVTITTGFLASVISLQKHCKKLHFQLTEFVSKIDINKTNTIYLFLVFCIFIDPWSKLYPFIAVKVYIYDYDWIYLFFNFIFFYFYNFSFYYYFTPLRVFHQH